MDCSDVQSYYATTKLKSSIIWDIKRQTIGQPKMYSSAKRRLDALTSFGSKATDKDIRREGFYAREKA